MQIPTYADNMYKYVHTYSICTMCKCTYLFLFLSEYDAYMTTLGNTYEYVQHGSLMVLAGIRAMCAAKAPGSRGILSRVGLLYTWSSC